MTKIYLIASKDNNFYNFRSELILKLVELGYYVTLICPYGKKMDYFTERGCHFIDQYMDRIGKNAINDRKQIAGYYKILKNGKPDIVLTFTTKCSIYTSIVCRWLGIPYIVNNAGLVENNMGLLDTILRTLYKIGFSKAKCMMYQNSRERDYLNAIIGKNVHYRDIPGSGVNLDNFKFVDYPKDDGEIYFNYVARIVQNKGIDEYLECAKILKPKYPHCHFLIYGDYDNDEYRTIISDLINRGIIEYGGIQIDMKPCIARAHAAIHPSYYEGMTNVVLEHGSVGRPSIVSNIPGCVEGVDDGKSGYIFEVKNVPSMVKAVEKFINLPYADKVAMGKAAREKMEREFDRNIVTNTYIEEIDKILAGAKK